MGKHSIEQPKKSKTKAKKIILTVILMLIIIAIIYYTKNNTKVFEKDINTNSEEIIKENSEEETIEEDLEKLFSSLKSGDKNQATTYINYDELLSSLDEMFLTISNEEEMTNLEKLLFCDMEWKISSIEVSGDTATVIIKMTNKNYKDIITNWMKELVNEKNDDIEITTEIALELFEKELEENDNNTGTSIQEITLLKTDENWKVNVDDNVRNLFYPRIK